MTRTVVALLAALIAIGLGTACGGGGDKSDGNASATTHATAEDLLGTYERTVTKADIARTAKRVVEEPGFEPSPPGPRRLVIDDGTFTLTDLQDNFQISQHLTASDEGNFDIGDYIRPDKGAFCGPKVPQGAIYSWTLEGDVLTLRAESDSCADRDALLTGKWQRK
jgi:hypothetical protein